MKLKTFFLLLFSIFFWTLSSSSCSKDSQKTDPVFSLPPETQTGANTFGVTINGKVYIPRDPTGVNVGGPTPKGMKLLGGGVAPNDYTEIVVVDGASEVGFKLTIHLQNLFSVGNYILKESNFQDQADSVLKNHLFFKIFDKSINNYAYYGSVDNESIVTIKRLSNGIVSGSFSGKFFRFGRPLEIITITDGRFDINSFTVSAHPFP